MADVRIPTGRRELTGVIASPKPSRPSPGIVVLHDVLGLTGDVADVADRYAAAGYLAVAPDLMAGAGKTTGMWNLNRAALTGQGAVLDDIDDVRAWLEGRSDCTGAVAVTGFGAGAGLALSGAGAGRFAAAACFDPHVPKQPEDVLRGGCPVFAMFSAAPRIGRSPAERLAAALTALGIPHDVGEFELPRRRRVLPSWRRAAAARQRSTPFAWLADGGAELFGQTVAFFDRHVRAPSG